MNKSYLDDGMTSYSANTVSYSDYYPYGMLLPNRHGEQSSAEYRYGFNGQEADDEIAGKGNSYTAEFWQYDSRLGRRWNIDPVVKYHESPYAAFANNPIWFTDPNGADTIQAPNGENVWLDGSLDASYDGTNFVRMIGEYTSYYLWDSEAESYNKTSYKDGQLMWGIWQTAEIMATRMQTLDNFGAVGKYDLIYNYLRGSAKAATWTSVDQSNPGWTDLAAMFLFEVGSSTINIEGNDKTTIKDLKSHAGVNSARWAAFQDWNDGSGDREKSSYLNFGYGQLKDNLTNGMVWLEVLLGSYQTTTQVTKSGDIYSFTFKVYNKSGAESFTRFLRHNGEDVGMLQDRPRGTKWGLGGDFYQNFKWTEKYKLVDGQFVPYTN